MLESDMRTKEPTKLDNYYSTCFGDTSRKSTVNLKLCFAPTLGGSKRMAP